MLEYPVLTPENVRFHHTLAGPGSRLLAFALDATCVLGALLLLGLGLTLLAPIFGDYATAVYALATGAFVLGYWIVGELAWNGQTPGKRLLGLRVVSDGGLRLQPAQVVLRNVLRVVDLLPGLFGVGALVALLHPEHRRLGDIVAGTLVVRERRVAPPELLLDAVDQALGADALLPAALRRAARSAAQSIPAERRRLLLEIVLRRDELGGVGRGTLFAQVAQDLAVELGQGPAPGQSDERFVLAVCAELFGG